MVPLLVFIRGGHADARTMHFRSSLALTAAYIGVVVVALAMIAAGLSAVMLAAVGGMSDDAGANSLVQDQIESSREIRRALATPITVPPLPPITARRAHEIPAAISQRRPTLSPKALDAMAMDQSATGTQQPSPAPAVNVRDRLTGGGW